jgi:hypothetical protein
MALIPNATNAFDAADALMFSNDNEIQIVSITSS